MLPSVQLSRRRFAGAVPIGVAAGIATLSPLPGAVASRLQDVPEGDLSSDDPAAVAVGLADLERAPNYGALYARLHPDSRALTSESAVIGWYAAEFAPRDPGPVSEVVSVETIDWTWEVTGETYPDTAEVVYRQPFGGTEEDVTVRLVRSNDRWKWFFGRDLAFVEAQEAAYGDGTPPGETLPPEELADAVAALDRATVEPYLTAEGLTLDAVEVRFPDPDATDAGATPVVIMAATLTVVGGGPTGDASGEVTLSVAAYADSGLAAMNSQRNQPSDASGDPENQTVVALVDGGEADLVYGDPFEVDGGEVSASAQARVDAAVVRTIFTGSGDDPDGIVAAVVNSAIDGLNLLAAVNAGEI